MFVFTVLIAVFVPFLGIMAGDTYTQELRGDTSNIIIPVTTFVVVFVSFFMAAVSMGRGLGHVWYLILISIVSPLTSYYAWNLIRKGKQERGTAVFIFTHIFLLTLVFVANWHPNTPIAYFYAVFIIASTMMAEPRSGLFVWAASTAFMLAGLALGYELSAINMLDLVVPISLNLVLAIIALLTALEWETAVQSVNILHRRAQNRRDDLFVAKEELNQNNHRLKYLNQQLEVARQEAVMERDLRTRFMNNVSHELRTPMNAIVNFAHIIQNGGCGPVTEHQVNYLNRIETSGWHLLSILNDLLDMAQIQSGEFKLYLEVTDLHSICEEAMGTLRGLILDKDVEPVRDYPATWPLINVDRMRIKQALINLLGNAAKYTESGEITMRVRPFERQVAILIEDTGIGIPSEHLEDIFLEFHQVDESAARKRIGTGLGLPITRHLIERHGGTITVSSEVGKGSIFTITLPIYQPDSPLEVAEKSIST